MAAHIARKRFGQHFLTAGDVIDRIIRAIGPQPGERLVEIGPGLGAMTIPLRARCDALTVIELDRDLAARLRQRGDLDVVESDVLKVDFAALAERLGGPIRVVGNLPYNISSPILFHLISSAPHVVDQVFMLQKEVVDRMAAEPGGKVYGRLSVMLQLACKVTPLFTVPPGAFRPPPKVDSAVVRLVPLAPDQLPKVDSAKIYTIVKAAFAMRRKTLSNTLKGLVDEATIRDLGIDPRARAETLPPGDFVKLANAM